MDYISSVFPLPYHSGSLTYSISDTPSELSYRENDKDEGNKVKDNKWK